MKKNVLFLREEESKSGKLAAVYVSACQTLRDSEGHTEYQLTHTFIGCYFVAF